MKATLKIAIAIAFLASTVLLYRRLSTTESIADATPIETTATETTGTDARGTTAAGD